MPSQRNKDIVASLVNRLRDAKSICFTQYTGLSVPLIQELRSQVKEVDGEVTIAKNTLVSIAFREAGLKTEGLDLSGQTALILSYNDPIGPIKSLYGFIKENELPVVTGGYFEGSLLSIAAMDELSQLPGRQELLGMTVSTLAGPIRGLVGVLNGVQRDLVMVLSRVSVGK